MLLEAVRGAAMGEILEQVLSATTGHSGSYSIAAIRGTLGY